VRRSQPNRWPQSEPERMKSVPHQAASLIMVRAFLWPTSFCRTAGWSAALPSSCRGRCPQCGPVRPPPPPPSPRCRGCGGGRQPPRGPRAPAGWPRSAPRTSPTWGYGAPPGAPPPPPGARHRVQAHRARARHHTAAGTQCSAAPICHFGIRGHIYEAIWR
jgi:hypothetical protein